ncbi:hypothetical protein ABZT03_40845 [Streptomyces sp. NPDC005574]|uniref:hypothetical protein n=1 Tax=Streptomyces sp. NPDC005574 TaxID=3156891 RepID=UPI0033BF0C4E
MTKPNDTSRIATELTTHLLQAPDGPDAAAYDLITQLCPRGIYDLLPLTLHLAEAFGALLEERAGSRETAIEALKRQPAEERN